MPVATPAPPASMWEFPLAVLEVGGSLLMSWTITFIVIASVSRCTRACAQQAKKSPNASQAILDAPNEPSFPFDFAFGVGLAHTVVAFFLSYSRPFAAMPYYQRLLTSLLGIAVLLVLVGIFLTVAGLLMGIPDKKDVEQQGNYTAVPAEEHELVEDQGKASVIDEEAQEGKFLGSCGPSGEAVQ